MVSKLFLGVVAGVTAAVGYCIYFDQKRRSDPFFRQKLREKRARRQATSRSSGMPDPSDPEAMQRYFMIQLQRGEACLMNGMLEESVQHFCNAVKASGAPSQLLRILAESLPPQVFNLVVRHLESDVTGGPSKTTTTTRTTSMGPGAVLFDEERKETVSSGPTVTLVEDDVE